MREDELAERAVQVELLAVIEGEHGLGRREHARQHLDQGGLARARAASD